MNIAEENQFIKRKNALTDSMQQNSPDINKMLVDVMKNEYPDNPVYLAGNTYTGQNQPLVSPTGVEIRNTNQADLSTRNELNYVKINSRKNQKTKYKLTKMLPTINGDDLDDYLDDEWVYYLNPRYNLLPRTDGLFIINREINLNPPDFHHLYITSGPATIQDRLSAGETVEEVIATTFCVYFIENSVALPIPNYKTLEVMLVERGKTYNDISEATPEQLKEFDLVMDGKFLQDNENLADPYEEFIFRQVLDRTIVWNERIRFDSGYTLGFNEDAVQFQRDPGDYLLPDNQKTNSRSGIYNPKVFQKQTYREKLREKYEGKMVALQWPVPYDSASISIQTGYTSTTPSNTLISDDKIFYVRMMINGFWKQVISLNVFRQFALLNNLSLTDIKLDEPIYGPNGDKFIRTAVTINQGPIGTNVGSALQTATNSPKAGLYGVSGIINLLKENGGLEVIQDFDVDTAELDQARALLEVLLLGINSYDNDGNIINSDGNILYTKQEADDLITGFLNEIKAPGWTDFPHIIEVDRLNSSEYEEYLNNYNNGGDPFGIEHLQPYEPPGSIKYYPSAQLDRLQQQANDQAAVNQIKSNIQEILPGLAARAAELNQRFNAQPANYEAYVLKKLGPNSDLYKVMHPSQDFQYKKKRSSGTIVDKGEETSFLRLAEKEWRVFYNMSPGEEDGIFYESGKRDWWRNVCQNDAILTPLRDYEDKLLKDSWIKSIDSDGRGYADQIAKLEQTTDNVVNNVQDFSNNISVSVNDAINTTANNLSNAVEGFGDSAATVTSNIATSLDAYQAPTVTGPSNIQNVDATNVGSLDLTNTVNQGIDALNSSLNAATTALNTGFANLDTGLSNAGTAVESFGSNIQVGTQQLSAQIQTTAANLSADITEGIQNITDDTVNLIESTSDIIGDGIALANDIQSIVDVGRGDEMYDYNSDKRKRAPRGDHGDRKGRLLKRKKYTKLCIAAYLFVEKVRKESSGLVNANGDAVDIFGKASEIDLSFTDYRSVIDQALNDIKQIDNDLVTSTTQAQFIAIYDKLLQTQAAFDDIDLTIFEQGEALKKQIDEIFKYMILQQYSAIQHVRKKLYDGTNKKYFIVWSAGAQAVIESVVGGKVFDNYQPSDYNQE